SPWSFTSFTWESLTSPTTFGLHRSANIPNFSRRLTFSGIINPSIFNSSHPPRLGDPEQPEEPRHLPREDTRHRQPAIPQGGVGLLGDRVAVVELVEGLREGERVPRER